MTRDALERRSKDELIALVLALATQVEALTKRVAELEAKLGQPPKTPDKSSLPPSQGEKTDRPAQPTKPRRGRPGTFRALAEHPDPLVEAFATACPYCCPHLAPADHSAVHAADFGVFDSRFRFKPAGRFGRSRQAVSDQSGTPSGRPPQVGAAEPLCADKSYVDSVSMIKYSFPHQ